MGTGGLICSSRGGWIAGFTCFEGGGGCVLVELLTVKRGMLLTWERGFRNVFLESDSQDLVYFLQRRNFIHLHVHASVAMEIVDLMSQDWCVKGSHIFREANAATDTWQRWVPVLA